jgi:hypothetical protein
MATYKEKKPCGNGETMIKIKMDFLDGCTLVSVMIHAVCCFVPLLPDGLSNDLSKSSADAVIGWFSILYFIVWLTIIISSVEDDISITFRKVWSYKFCFYFLTASSMLQSCLWKFERVSEFFWLATISILLNEVARHFLVWMEDIRNNDQN